MSTDAETAEIGTPCVERLPSFKELKEEQEYGLIDSAEKAKRKLAMLQGEISNSLGSMNKVLQETQKVLDETSQFLIGKLKDVPSEQLSAKILETFAEIDTNHNGVLDKQELETAFVKMGRKLTSMELEIWLEAMDEDDDGTVDEEEFEHMVRNLMGVDCVPACAICAGRHSKFSVSSAGPSRTGSESGGQWPAGRTPSKAEASYKDPMLSKFKRISVETKSTVKKAQSTLTESRKILAESERYLVGHFSGITGNGHFGERMKATFDLFDADSSGFIDRNELSLAFRTMGRTLSAEEVDGWMATLDVDGNGVIDEQEFEHIVRQLLKVPCKPELCKICAEHGPASNLNFIGTASLSAATPPAPNRYPRASSLAGPGPASSGSASPSPAATGTGSSLQQPAGGPGAGRGGPASTGNLKVSSSSPARASSNPVSRSAGPGPGQAKVQVRVAVTESPGSFNFNFKDAHELPSAQSR